MAPLSFSRLRLSSRSSNGKTPATAGGCRSSRSSSNDRSGRDAQNSADGAEEEKEDVAAAAHVAGSQHSADPTPSRAAASATPAADNPRSPTAVTPPPPLSLCATAGTAANTSSRDSSGPLPNPHRQRDSLESSLRPNAPQCANQQQPQQQAQRRRPPVQQREGESTQQCRQEDHLEQYRQYHQQQQRQPQQQHKSKHQKQQPQQQDLIFPPSHAVRATASDFTTTAEAAQPRRLRAAPAAASSRTTLAGADVRNPLVPLKASTFGARAASSSPSKKSRLAAAARALLSPQAQSPQQQQPAEGRGNGNRGKSSLIEQLLFRKKDKRQHTCDADKPAADLLEDRSGSRDNGNQPCSETAEHARQAESEEAAVAASADPGLSVTITSDFVTPRSEETPNGEEEAAEEEKVVEGEEVAALPARTVKGAPPAATAGAERRLFSTANKSSHSDEPSADENQPSPRTKQHQVKNELALQRQTEDGCCTSESSWLVIEEVKEDGTACDSCAARAAPVGEASGTFARKKEAAPAPVEDSAAVAEEDNEEEKAKHETAAPNEEAVLPTESSGAAAEEEEEEEEDTAVAGQCETNDMKVSAVFHNDEAAPGAAVCAAAATPRHDEGAGEAMAAGGAAAAHHIMEEAGGYPSEGAVSRAAPSERMPACSQPGPQLLGDACCSCSSGSKERHKDSCSSSRDSSSCSSERYSHLSDTSVYVYDSSDEPCCEEGGEKKQADDVAAAASGNGAGLIQQESRLWETHDEQQQRLQQQSLRALRQQERQRKKPEQKQQQQDVKEKPQQPHRHPKQQQRSERRGQQQKQRRQSLGQKQHQRRHRSAEEELLRDTSEGMPNSSAAHAAAASPRPLYWRDRSRSSGSSRKRCSSRDSSRNRSSRGSSRNRSSSNIHKDARVSASHGNSLFKTSEPHPTEPHDNGDEKAASVFGSAATAAGLAAAGSDAAAGLDLVPAAGPSPAAAAAAPDMADGALGCRPSASKESTKETQQKKEKPQLLRLSLFALPLSHGSCSLQSSRSHAAGTGVLQGQQRLGLPETGLSTAAPRPSVPRPTAAESATRTARIEGAAVLANAAALQDTVAEATGATPGAESTQQHLLADTGMCVFVREVRPSHRASTDPLLLNSSQLACEENSCGGTGGEERVRRQQPCWNGFRCNGCSSTPQSLCCSARKNSCSTRSGCSSTSSGSARCSAGPSTKGATSSSRSTGSSCRTDSGSTLGSDTGSLHCSSSEREGRASSEDCSSDGSVQGLSSGSTRSRKPSVETDETPDGTLCSAPVGRRSSHGSHNDGEGSTSNTPRCLSRVSSASSLPSCNGLSKCPAAVAASELRGKEGVVQTNTRQRVSHPQQHHRQGGEHLPQPPFHHDDQNQWHQRQQQQTQQQQTQQQQTQQQQIQQQQMQQQQTEQQKPSSGCPPVRPKSVVCSASSGSAVLPIASPRTRPRGILPTPRELQQQPLSETPAAAAAAAAKAAARQRHLPVAATGALPPNAISSGSECARDGPKEEAQGGGRRAAARAGRRRTSLAGGSAAATPVTTEAFAACSLEELERESAVTEKRGAAATAAAGPAYTLWNTYPDEEAAEPPRASAAADKRSPTDGHQEEQKAGSCRLNTRRATEQPGSKRGAAAAAVTAAGRSRMKSATAVAAAAAAEENSVASSSTCRRPTDSGVRKGKMIVKEPESLSADDTSRESDCCALDFLVHADGNANAARRRDTRALQRLPAAAAAGTTAAARRRAVPASRGVAPAAARGVAGERAAPRGGGEGRESAAAAAGRRGKAVADLEGEERRASLPRTLLALPQKKATGGGSRETSVARVTAAAAPTWPPRRARAEPAAASGVLMGRNFATGEDPWSSEFACGVSLRWQQDLGEERRRSRQDGPQGDGEWTIRRSNKEAGAGGGVGERAAEANQEENSFYRLKQGKKERRNAQEESLDQEEKATLRFLASGEAAADKEERNAGAGIWQRSEEKEEEVGGTEDEEQFLCQEAENESARKEEEEFLEQTEEQDQCSDSGKASGDASSVVVYETDDDAADSSRSAESFGSNSEDSAGERSRRCSNSSKAYASSSRRSSDSALCSSCCPKCPSHGRRTSDSNSLAATAAAAAAACMESAPSSSFVASLSATAADFPDESPSTERLHVAAAAAVEAEAASQKETTADDSAAATAGEVHTGAPTTAAVAAVEEEEEEEEEQHPIEGINEEERSEASTAEAEIGGEPEERAAASAGRHELSTGKTDDEARESSLSAAAAAPEAWKTDAAVVIAAAGAAAAGASPRVTNGEKASSRINATHEGAAAAPTATGIEDKDNTRRLLAEQTVGTVWPDRTGWGHAGQGGCSASAAAPGDAATMVDPSSLLAVAAAALNAECKVTAGWRLGCSSNKATSAPTKTTATHALPPARVVAEEAAAAEVAHEQEQDEMCVAASLTKSPGHRITPAAAAAEEKEEREEKASDTARATRVMTATATAAVSQSAARETEGPVPRERSKCSQCGLHLPVDELADHLLAHALSESPRAAAAAGVLECQEFQQQQQEQLQELGQQVYRWPDPPWLQRHQSCNGTSERSAQTKHSFWPPFLTLQAQQGNRYSEEVAVPPQQQHVTDDLLHEEEDPQQHRTSLPSTAYHPQLSTGAAAVDPVACFARSAVEPADVTLSRYHTAGGAGGPAAAPEGRSSQFQALPRGSWPSGSQGSSSKEDARAAGGDTPAAAAETAVTPATTSATRSVKKQQQQLVLHVASEEEEVPGAPVDGGKEAGDEEVKEEKNEKEQEGQRPKETQAAPLGHGEAGCTRAATTAEATSAAGAGAAAAVAKVPGTMVAASAPAAGHGSADEQRQNEAGEAKMLPKWKGWASCGKNTRVHRAEFEQDGAGGAAASLMVLRSRSAPERGGEASYIEVAASASNCFASINLRNRGTAVGVVAENNIATKRETQGPAESGPGAAVDVEAPADLPAASGAAEKAAAAVGAAPRAGPEAKPAEATGFLGERENATKKDSEAPHEGEEAGAPRTTADLRRTAGEETAATAEENSGVCWEPSGCRHSADASRRKTACDRNKSAEQQRADEGKAGPSSDTAAELAGGGCSTVLEREAQTLRRCSSPSCDATAATAGSSFREFSSPCLSSSSCSRAIDSGSSGTQPRISRSRKPGSSSGEMTYRDGAAFASSTSVNAKPEEGRRGSRSSSSSVHSGGNDGQGRSRLPSRGSSAGGRRKSRNSSVGSSSSNSRSSSSSHRSSAPRRRPWGSVLISQEPTSGRVQQQKEGGSCMQQLLCQTDPAEAETCDTHSCAVAERSVPEEDLQTNMTRSSRSASDGSCSDSGPRHGRGGEQSSDRRRPPQGRLRRESERRGSNLSRSSFPCSSREKDRPQTCRCSPRVGSGSADRYAVQRCRCSAGTACCGCSASAGDAAAALGGRRQHIAHEEPHRRSSSGKHGSSCSNGTSKSSRPCSGDQHTSSGSQNPHGNSRNTADCPSSRQEDIPARTSSNTEGSCEAKTSGQGRPHRRGSSSSDSCRSSEHTSDSNKNTSSLDDSRSEASVGSGCRTHARASNRNTLGEREKRNSRRRRSVRQLRQKQRQLSGDLQRHQDDQAKDTKSESQQQGREGEGTALVSPTARTCSAEDCGATAGCSSGMPPLRRRLRAPAYQQQEHSEGTPPQKRQAAAQQPPAQQQQPSAQQQQPSTQQQQGSLETQQMPEQHLTPAASDRLMLRTELAVSSSRDNSTEGRSSRCASSRSSVSGETVGINIACVAASGTNRTSITTPGQRWVGPRSSNSPPAPEETTTCGAEASVRISAASMRGASSSAAAPPSGMSLAHMYSDDPSAALTSSADRRLAAAAFFGPTEGAAAADAWDETVAVPAVGSVAWTVGAAAAGSNPKAAAAAAALKKGSRRGSEAAGQTQSNLVRSRVGEQPKLPPFRRRRLEYFAAEQASTETGEQTAAAVQQRSAETARERHQPLDAASQEQRAADQQAPVEQQAAAVLTGTGEQQQQQHPGAEMHRFAAADGALHGPQTQAATGVGASAGCLTSRNTKPSSKTPRPIGLLPCLAAAAAHRAAAANAASSSSAANSERETAAGGRHVRSTRAAAKAAATQKGGESRKSSSSPVSSNSRLSSNGGFSSSSSTSSRQQSGGSKAHQSTRGSAGLNLRRRGAMQEEGSGNQLHAAHPRTSPAAAPDAAGRGSGAATARFHRCHLQLRTAGLISGRGADGPAAASTRAPPPATARLQQSDPPLRLTSQGLRRYMSYSRQQQLQQEQRRAKCAAAAMARAARAAAAAETASSGAPADEPPTLGDATVVLPAAARDARAATPRPTTAAGRGPAGARRRSAEVAATGRAGTRFERGFPTCCASAAVDLTADGTGGSGQPAAGAAAAAAVEAEPREAASDAEESAAEDASLVETEALVVPVPHRLLASGPTALNLCQQEQQQQQERRERIGERHHEQLEQQHLVERVCSDGPHEAGRSPRFHHGVAPAASAFTEASVDRQRSAAAQEETIYDEGEVRSISSGSGSRVSPGANELDSVEELPLEPGAAPSTTAEDSLAQTERTSAIAAGRAQHDTAAAGAATTAEAPASATATAAPAASPRLLEGGNRTSRGGNSSGVHCVPPLHLASLRAGPAGLPTASSRGRDVSSAGSSPGVAEVPAAAAEPCGRRKGEGGHSLAAKERETGTPTTATAVEPEEEGKHNAVSSEEETSTVVSRGGANSSRTAASVASPPATASPLSIRTSRLRPCRYPSSSPPPSSTEKSAPHPPSGNTLRNASSSSSAPPRPPAASPGGTASRLHSGHSSSTALSGAAAGSSRQRSTAKQDAGFAASSTRRTQAVAGSAGTSTESTATPSAAAGSASRQTSSLTSAAAASSSTTASLVSRQTSRGSVGASTATQRMTSLSVHDGSSTSSSGSRLPPSSRSGASNGSGANNSRGEEAGTPVCRREPLSTSLSHSLRRGGATSGTQDLQRRGVSKASSPPEPQREEAGAARPQDRRPSSLTARRTSSATSAGLPPSPSAAAGSSSSTTRSSGTPSGSSSRGYASLAAPARGTGEYPTGSSSGWVPTWGQTLIDLGLVRAPGQHQLPPASCRATTRESSTAAEEPPRRGCLSARRPPTISEATLADGGSATGSAGAGASSPSTTTVSQREGGAADASVSWTVREEQRTPLTPSTTVEPPSPQHRSLSGVGSSSSVAYSQSTQRYNGTRALYSSSSSSGSSSSSSSSSSPYLERAVVRSRYAAPTEASEARRQAISAYQLQSGVWSRDPSSSSVHRQRTAADTSFASSESPLLLRSTSPVPVSPLVLDYSGSSSSSSGRSSSVSATAASPPTLRRSVAAASGWSLESHASPQHGYQQQQPHSSLEYYYTTAAGGGGGGGGYPAGYSSTQLMQQQHHMRRQTMNAAFPSSFSAGSRQSAGTRTGGRESPGGVFAAAGASVVSPSHFGAGTGGRASLPPSPLVYSNARLAAQGRGVAACLIDPSIGAAASSSSSSSRSHYAVPSSALPAGVYSPSSTHYQQQPTQPSRRYSASHPLGSSRSSSSSISVSSSNSTATSNLPRAHTSCLSRGARRSVGGILQHQHVYDRGSTGGRFYLERSDGIPWAHVTRVAAHYPGRFSFREESVSRGAETYYQRMQQDEERRREDMLQVLIDLLPTSQFNSRRSATLSEEAKKCSICFEDYEHDDEQRRLPCTHVFHKNCIDIWLRRSLVCPMCKHDLRSAF